MHRSEVFSVMLLAIAVMGFSSLVNDSASCTSPLQIFNPTTLATTQTIIQRVPITITKASTTSNVTTVSEVFTWKTIQINTTSMSVTFYETRAPLPLFLTETITHTTMVNLTWTNSISMVQSKNLALSLEAVQLSTLTTNTEVTFVTAYYTTLSPIIVSMLSTGQVDPWFIMFFGLTLIAGVGLGCFLPFRKRTVVQETKFLIQGNGAPFAVLSDIGKRAQNEDSVAIEFTKKSGAIHDRQCSVVVADGVSGESEGKTASSLAVNTILAHIGTSDRRDEEVLRAALIEANRAIINQSINKLQGQRLASTVVAAIVSRSEIALGSVGDSRAYLFRNGRLYRLTKDDTVTQALLDARRISEAEAERHPERHKLTKALGQKPDLDPAVGTYEAARGDVLLCCSDGLTDGLTDTRIASIMRGAQDMEKLSETLVQYAKSAGSQDNVTVALLRID